jgi:hypothetical protein
MAEYPGAAWAGVSPNRSDRQGKVRLFIVHHYAGTQDPASARARFMAPNDRSVSPNYQVNADGSVYEIVPPDRYRAWTTGAIDHQAVTCETQNTTGAPSWGISHESHEAIAHLIAWASARYGFPIQRGRVADGNVVEVPGVVGHRETPAGRQTSTSCPGPSMDLDWLVARARQIANGEDDMGTLDNTEENYQTFMRWLQRALKFDVRTDGAGPDWKLGPTVFELLRAADDSSDVAGVKGAVSAIAVKMTDEDRAAIAKSVAESIQIPSGGATKADVAAAIDAGLAKLVLKPATP